MSAPTTEIDANSRDDSADVGLQAGGNALSGERERRGRLWLLWSVVVCPCHLPVTMGVLGTVLGGTTFGAVVARNTVGVGLVFGALYLVGLAIAFRHLRAAAKATSCDAGVCTTS